jgi:predicted NUDIX family NTP pyrophosphohydrolase
MCRKSEISAGLLAFRRNNGVEVLLVHPGGPLWAFYNRSILCDRNEFGSLTAAAYKKRLEYPMFLGLDLVRAV